MNNSSNRSPVQGTRKSAEFWSVLVVPDGGIPHRYRLRVLWLKLAAISIAVFLVILTFAVMSYSTLFSKALERDNLLVENAKLVKENQQIVKLSEELNQNKQSLDRIVRSLGGKLDLTEPSLDPPK